MSDQPDPSATRDARGAPPARRPAGPPTREIAGQIGGEIATVHALPVRPDPQVPAVPAGSPGPAGAVLPGGEVVDGQLVSEAEYRRLTSEKAKAIERWREYRSSAVTVAQVTRTVATHESTRTVGRAVVRNVLYVPAGAAVVAKRVWEAKTNSRYERLMRAAETAGDREALLEWEARAEAARDRRHRRRMEWLDAPAKLAKAAGITALSLVVALLAVGVVLGVAEGDAGAVLGPIRAVIDLVRWIVWAAAIAWGPLVLACPWVVVAALWQIGRARGATPDWVAPAARRREATAEPITPSVVVNALRELGIRELRRKIEAMEDAGASLLGPITLAGCGVEVDVLLPPGATTTAEVQRRRRRLAENLTRHEHEVYITIPRAARTVRLWIADPGALDEPIGPSPLVTDPDWSADVYTGRAPWGQSLRGEAVLIRLLQRHVLVTGLSNQGKTAALRALALWLAGDPVAELHIADLKGIGDWHMFTDLADTLIEGPTDGHACQATHLLEWGVAEMERRLAALDPEQYPDGVTRDLARSGQGFHPITLIVDEAQNAFMNPLKDTAGTPYGGKSDKSRYFMAARKIHNQGRAVNVCLWQGTQDPTDQNLPKLVREGAHLRACLVVGSEEQSRMALGDKAVNGGAAPHKLRQGLDKGTLVVTGDLGPDVLAPDQAAITVRTHYIGGTDATTLAEQIKARRGRRTTRTGNTGPAPARDLLADLATVLRGRPRERTEVIRQRLAELAPDVYEGWSAQDLAAALTNEGIPIGKVRGNKVVRAADVATPPGTTPTPGQNAGDNPGDNADDPGDDGEGVITDTDDTPSDDPDEFDAE